MVDERKRKDNILSLKTEFHFNDDTHEITWQLAGINDKHSIVSDKKSAERNSTNDPRCPNCGLSFFELLECRRVGCADCYTTFGDKMELLLNTLQGGSEHKGKKPSVDISITKAISEKIAFTMNAKRELKEAIETENYEKAALLRDKLSVVNSW